MAADVRNRQVLSGSTDNKPVVVASVDAASPTTIHQTGAAIDEVTLWGVNTGDKPAWVTIFWGDVTDPTHLACDKVLLHPNSVPTKLIDDMTLKNSLYIKAYASVASVINILGNVNRIT